ncbi:MAG: hypothetical protein KJS67_02285 [Actinomycetales bacterium]|jgi:hypothetical protein|nr:hypothetical protein [Actinomycetales bacterium]
MFTLATKVFAGLALSEKGRELPAHPIFFGLFAFGILMFLLYLVMRLDKD